MTGDPGLDGRFPTGLRFYAHQSAVEKSENPGVPVAM